jgi:hypothetical protein
MNDKFTWSGKSLLMTVKLSSMLFGFPLPEFPVQELIPYGPNLPGFKHSGSAVSKPAKNCCSKFKSYLKSG